MAKGSKGAHGKVSGTSGARYHAREAWRKGKAEHAEYVEFFKQGCVSETDTTSIYHLL